MNCHKLFKEFNGKITLANSKQASLKNSRKALRKKIRNYFDDNKWDRPKFTSQGSFPLQTNLNPIKEKDKDGETIEPYDLDDGVYIICAESERLSVDAYHSRILNAVENHAKDEVDKTTCVRVCFADGHHIDLPIYWLEKDGDIPLLAHKAKGYIESDPKAFTTWVQEQINKANLIQSGQLLRLIRYAKAWKNYRETENSSLRLPSGFLLTVLFCEEYVPSQNDDESLKITLERIFSRLEYNYQCFRPTTPNNEDLLVKYPKDSFLPELKKFRDWASDAIKAEDEKKSSEIWRKCFGDRFPLGKEDSEKGDKGKTSTTGTNSYTRVHPSRPYYAKFNR